MGAPISEPKKIGALMRRVGAVLVVAMLAAACASSEEGARPPAEAPAAVKATDPNLGLEVGLAGDTYVLSGPTANLGANVNITETLVYLSPTFEPKPLLAERWELRPNADPDRTTWRFHLRRGVTFHDGQAFNAEAVKRGLFDRVATFRNGGTIRAGTDSAVVVDEYTIDFTPTVANMRVPEQLVHPATGAVLAPGTTMEAKPVGTGPFRFVEYQPKVRLVVERNADYWGAKAAAARVTFRFYDDPATRLAALRGGEVNVAIDVPRSGVRELNDKGFKVLSSPVGSYQAMYVNLRGTLADREVRLAVAEAIDRKGIVDGVFEGLASTSQTFVPEAALGRYASEVKGVAYDPAGAAARLERAGWVVGSDGIRRKGGSRLELTLVSGFPSAAALAPMPTFVQQQLRKVGIDVTIDDFIPNEAVFNSRMKDEKGDLFLEQASQNDGNPAFLPANLLYTGNGPTAETRTVAAPGRPFDDILAPVFREADLDKVKAAVAKAMRLVVDQEVAVIPLAGIYRLYAMHDKVQGLTPHPAFLNVRWSEAGLTSK